MRGLQPLHNLQGMSEGRPGADSGGTGSAAAGAPAPHRMKPRPRTVAFRSVAFQGWGALWAAPILGGILSALLPFFFCLSFAPILAAQAIPYSRPVETAPQQDTIGGGYKTPAAADGI